MAKIYILSAVADSGKTDALKRTRELLLSINISCDEEIVFSKDVTTVEDATDFITILDSVNNHRIGISTAGDTVDDVIDGINLLFEKNEASLVCVGNIMPSLVAVDPLLSISASPMQSDYRCS